MGVREPLEPFGTSESSTHTKKTLQPSGMKIEIKRNKWENRRNRMSPIRTSFVHMRTSHTDRHTGSHTSKLLHAYSYLGVHSVSQICTAHIHRAHIKRASPPLETAQRDDRTIFTGISGRLRACLRALEPAHVLSLCVLCALWMCSDVWRGTARMRWGILFYLWLLYSRTSGKMPYYIHNDALSVTFSHCRPHTALR